MNENTQSSFISSHSHPVLVIDKLSPSFSCDFECHHLFEIDLEVRSKNQVHQEILHITLDLHQL